MRGHRSLRTGAYAPILAGLCLFGAAAFMRCASLDSIAGTGLQAGNGRIACTVYYEDGSPAAHALVLVRAHDYLADTAGASLKKNAAFRRDTRTDARGFFSVSPIDTGRYCIEVNDGMARAVVLRCTVSTGTVSVQIPDDTLRATGTLKGAVAGAPDFPGTHYVRLYGLERIGRRNVETGGFIIHDVPIGRYRLRVQASSALYAPVDIDDVTMDSAVTSSIGTIDYYHLSQWKYSRKVSLNTTPTGAAIAGMVTNFPVVIRLRGTDFDFGQPRPDGGDLCFAKPDGTSLPHEIERWDAERRQAEIWVTVDTVRGNDDTQQITMYWGNPNAASTANSAAVFDTANGFAGVWHMNEDPSAAGGSFKDRTANSRHATAFGAMTAANSVPGAVGNGLELDGKDDYLNAGNVSVSGNYTVGVWVSLDTLGDYQRLISKDSSYTLWYDKDSVSVRMEHMPQGSWWRGLLQDGGTRAPMTTGTWYYLVGTFDGSAVRLYVNGVEVSRSQPISAPPKVNAKPVFFGRSWDPNRGSFVNGKIDEIRIERVARSADWIKLCHMNQGQEDRLVVFK